MSRTDLTSATTYYCNPTGDPANSGLSVSAPKRNPIDVYNMLQADYDLRGNPVTVQCAAGTYTGTNQFVGPLVGSRGSRFFRIRGSTSSPNGVLFKPSSGYCFSVDEGASCVLEGLAMDGMDSDGGVGQDLTAVGRGSTMVWDDKLVFKRALNPWNHCSVNGVLYIESGPVGTPKGYSFDAGLFYKTWNPVTGDNRRISVGVGNTADLRPFMGVNGSWMSADPAQFVQSVDHTTGIVTLGYALTGTPNIQNIGVNFSWGAQCHILVGELGLCQWITNAEEGRAYIDMNWAPLFWDAYLTAYQNGVINYSAVAKNAGCNAQGHRYKAQGGGQIHVEWTHKINPATGVLYTAAEAETFLPGSMAGVVETGGQYL